MTEQHREMGELGAYALGALRRDETRAVEAHVAGCGVCQAELAELRLVQQSLGEVPPEFFLDGPPDDGDLLLARTIRQVRDERRRPARRRTGLLAAVAAAAACAAVGLGVLVGQQTTDGAAAPPDATQTTSTPPSTSPSTTMPGTVTAAEVDDRTGAGMQVTITPADGWVRLEARVTGISAGESCRVVVVGRGGDEQVAGSWLVSETGEAEGTALSGFALVAPEDVTAVRVENFSGARFVSVPLA